MTTKTKTRTVKKAPTTEQPSRLPHSVTLDAYTSRDLPDFDVFSEIVGASTDTVERLVESEVRR